jgi:hypothetical protein
MTKQIKTRLTRAAQMFGQMTRALDAATVDGGE